VIVASVLQPLEDLLAWALTHLHDNIGLTWAWSIVALTIIVRILLVPLTVRQIHSMQNLQAHMPEMKAIQTKYKGDRQRQNEELMKFYRENNINPASSCLPIIAQIPVFIGLFFVLKNFTTHVAPNVPADQLEWLGLVNITENTKVGWGPLLVVIYIASQLTSSYFMSTTMQGAQRVMLMVLPIVFIPFVLNFPSGVMLYWVTTNLWTTGQGVITRRMIPKAQPPPKRSSRTPPKDDGSAGNGAKPEPDSSGPKPGAGQQKQQQPVRRVKRKKKAQRR
jgi:YidC/Oxa1 family membrane protein insertase